MSRSKFLKATRSPALKGNSGFEHWNPPAVPSRAEGPLLLISSLLVNDFPVRPFVESYRF